MKQFKDVQIGDIAIDYCDEQYEVIDKGPAKEMVDKYRFRSPGDWQEWLECAASEDDPVIVVKEHEPLGFEGYDVIVYAYGFEGAYVK